MIKVTTWQKILKDTKKKISKNFKYIKDDSLICSFSENLLKNFFDVVVKKNGKVLIAYKKSKIVGLLVMENKSIDSISFFKRNILNISLNLLFSKNMSDKKILLRYFFNFLFMKKDNVIIKNNIILVAVVPSERGKNIGKKLIKKLIKLVNSNLFVSTDSDNFRAQNFYKKNKFKYFKQIYYGIRKLYLYKLKNN
jgi:ribosomal protein S18 acetylase RimI-like enzyme|tara:strand:+ start:236 stop:820 length:585 start_codon:yes stop_codon:yes gene_type:complete